MPSQTIIQTVRHNSGLWSENHPALHTSLQLIDSDNNFPALGLQLESALKQDDNDALLSLYHQVIPLFEDYLWKHEQLHEQSQLHQALFLEMEAIATTRPDDKRHQIIIVIPVADRPRQLTSVINSIKEQCEHFGYGGNSNHKVSVVIADDSIHEQSIGHNQQLAVQTSKAAVNTIYFGRKQQQEIIDSLSVTEKQKVYRQVGLLHADADGHKGPSVMRNLSYLYLNRHHKNNPDTICYFIDSDQLFTVDSEDTEKPTINYFYYLDRLFSETGALVATGKVVGDPPVSPAVMANTLLDDVISFIDKALQLKLDDQCQFHQQHDANVNEAAYHDMADLFGFSPGSQVFEYACPLSGKHSNRDCLTDLCNRLGQFFYGEHPTRSTAYQHSNPLESIAPARTVYTGNYAFKLAALDYFIPFSDLRLRMAGPTLGRILKQEIGKQFVTVNLPMLHKRTLRDTGTAEFRPSVSQENQLVDLSKEFVRQYFGDVMLFSVEQLTTLGYPSDTPDEDAIRSIVIGVEEALREKYASKQLLILDKLNTLQGITSHIKDHYPAGNVKNEIIEALKIFGNNINNNYGPDSGSFRQINDENIRADYLDKVVTAIAEYNTDLANWKALLASQ
ncbi:MAG: hypothetical protein OQL16_11055 [Gammaproteobacteria bacterium]|nr:hypothetical protein [Gammaproteobacteria bacterium]